MSEPGEQRTVAELVSVMERIASTRLAESWDNVGLLVGDENDACGRVLLCIDLTAAVLAEAVSLRCQAVVAYHPLVIEGVKKIVGGDVMFEAARRGVAVYSPHTALDVAEGGTNDVLAEALGLREVVPLKVGETRGMELKLVTFVPEGDAEKVAEALFAAGAGRIGAYEKCSFRSKGVGTFFGGEGTSPAVGQAGKLERAEEVRIETVVPMGRVSAVVAALRKAHPYEEPAFDLNVLAAPPVAVGIGRVGLMDPTPVGIVAERLKEALGVRSLLAAGGGVEVVTKAAVCAGAGRSLVGEVIKSGANLFVTGELPHHDALRLNRAGVAVMATLHSNSERPVLGRVARKLTEEGFTAVLSRMDRDPFEVV
jgi:dinuclear metal center YbgI/SA1388 family protein